MLYRFLRTEWKLGQASILKGNRVSLSFKIRRKSIFKLATNPLDMALMEESIHLFDNES